MENPLDVAYGALGLPFAIARDLIITERLQMREKVSIKLLQFISRFHVIRQTCLLLSLEVKFLVRSAGSIFDILSVTMLRHSLNVELRSVVGFSTNPS